MRLNPVASGLALLFLTLGSVALVPATAQASSVFPFTLRESAIVVCWWFGVGFRAAAGQRFTVQWNQSWTDHGPVALPYYIATLAAVHKIWLCDDGPIYLYLNSGAYGSESWTAPSAGDYVIVVVNYSQYPISGRISIKTANATLSATPIGPSMVRRVLPICPFPRPSC